MYRDPKGRKIKNPTVWVGLVQTSLSFIWGGEDLLLHPDLYDGTGENFLRQTVYSFVKHRTSPYNPFLTINRSPVLWTKT